MDERNAILVIKYLNNKSWNDITREERVYCSHLYHSILSLPDINAFIAELNKIESPIASFKNKLNLPVEVPWEIGFEVCFYRDLLFAVGPSLRKENANAQLDFSEKRTFDLCLFSDDELVIIEAKAYQGLSLKQNKDFKKDREQIKKLFEYLIKIGKANEIPKIKFVIIASSIYYNSKSFTTEKGIGKRFIEDNASNDYLCGLISWQQISDQIFPSDPIFERADNVYGETDNS